jgi:AcrR family transcriptional regulator
MREMGVAKQSLYDTFGGKRDLYMKALVYYRDVTNGEMERLLAKIPSVKEGFAKLRTAWPAKRPNNMREDACSSARTCNATHPMWSSQISYVTIRRGSKPSLSKLFDGRKSKENCLLRRTLDVGTANSVHLRHAPATIANRESDQALEIVPPAKSLGAAVATLELEPLQSRSPRVEPSPSM